ncbi:MAG TPA: carboxypeptidase-like regulatory domain-containing protein, partial [Blastocatellia bacterium]
DDEGAPLIARHVQLFTLDDKGQKRGYSSSLMYYMSQTDDRGVYRIYGLPPGRYIISAGGEGGGDPLRAGGGKFALTYHPDTTDEKQARIIEIKEGSEVAEVDIRFGSARKTYVAAGRVAERDTGKPVPRISVACREKPEKNTSYSGTTAIADGQGNFRLPGLPPGRYQAMVMDDLSEAGYTGEAVEFEITNDDVSGLELKAFLGGSVSGVVVVESADATTRSQPLSITVNPRFKMLSGATGDADERTSFELNIRPARVNADGSFAIKGLRAGSLGFNLWSAPDGLRIKRVERDGVEIKDAIEVKPGEMITGVRIVAFRPQGRIRGQVQIVGGALPDGWRLHASAMRPINPDELKQGARPPVATDRGGGSVEIGKQGRFVIEGLPAGEYVLSVHPVRVTGDGSWSSVDSPGTNQQVIVRENDETTVTVTFDLSGKNQPKNQEDRQ